MEFQGEFRDGEKIQPKRKVVKKFYDHREEEPIVESRLINSHMKPYEDKLINNFEMRPVEI